MTPFGARLRQLREDRGIRLKDMAEELGVSATYLSALEHGRRSKPNWSFIQRVIHYFNIIWDEADELQRLADVSNPKITVDTAGLPPKATELANRLARDIATLTEADLDALLETLDAARKRSRT
ncbi:MAG: helix-turn-helix domain-containing protein [Beijerinckiaceae bacterium]|nr:helix-turn-helix domain-containing protein [Beijerinckiaceae bacterium]